MRVTHPTLLMRSKARQHRGQAIPKEGTLGFQIKQQKIREIQRRKQEAEEKAWIEKPAIEKIEAPKGYKKTQDQNGNIILTAPSKKYTSYMSQSKSGRINERYNSYIPHTITFDQNGNILSEVWKDDYESYDKDKGGRQVEKRQVYTKKITKYQNNKPIKTDEWTDYDYSHKRYDTGSVDYRRTHKKSEIDYIKGIQYKYKTPDERQKDKRIVETKTPLAKDYIKKDTQPWTKSIPTDYGSMIVTSTGQITKRNHSGKLISRKYETVDNYNKAIDQITKFEKTKPKQINLTDELKRTGYVYDAKKGIVTAPDQQKYSMSPEALQRELSKQPTYTKPEPTDFYKQIMTKRTPQQIAQENLIRERETKKYITKDRFPRPRRFDEIRPTDPDKVIAEYAELDKRKTDVADYVSRKSADELIAKITDNKVLNLGVAPDFQQITYHRKPSYRAVKDYGYIDDYKLRLRKGEEALKTFPDHYTTDENEAKRNKLIDQYRSDLDRYKYLMNRELGGQYRTTDQDAMTKIDELYRSKWLSKPIRWVGEKVQAHPVMTTAHGMVHPTMEYGRGTVDIGGVGGEIGKGALMGGKIYGATVATTAVGAPWAVPAYFLTDIGSRFLTAPAKTVGDTFTYVIEEPGEFAGGMIGGALAHTNIRGRYSSPSKESAFQKIYEPYTEASMQWRPSQEFFKPVEMMKDMTTGKANVFLSKVMPTSPQWNKLTPLTSAKLKLALRRVKVEERIRDIISKEPDSIGKPEIKAMTPEAVDIASDMRAGEALAGGIRIKAMPEYKAGMVELAKEMIKEGKHAELKEAVMSGDIDIISRKHSFENLADFSKIKGMTPQGFHTEIGKVGYKRFMKNLNKDKIIQTDVKLRQMKAEIDLMVEGLKQEQELFITDSAGKQIVQKGTYADLIRAKLESLADQYQRKLLKDYIDETIEKFKEGTKDVDQETRQIVGNAYKTHVEQVSAKAEALGAVMHPIKEVHLKGVKSLTDVELAKTKEGIPLEEPPIFSYDIGLGDHKYTGRGIQIKQIYNTPTGKQAIEFSPAETRGTDVRFKLKRQQGFMETAKKGAKQDYSLDLTTEISTLRRFLKRIKKEYKPIKVKYDGKEYDFYNTLENLKDQIERADISPETALKGAKKTLQELQRHPEYLQNPLIKGAESGVKQIASRLAEHLQKRTTIDETGRIIPTTDVYYRSATAEKLPYAKVGEGVKIDVMKQGAEGTEPVKVADILSPEYRIFAENQPYEVIKTSFEKPTVISKPAQIITEQKQLKAPKRPQLEFDKPLIEHKTAPDTLDILGESRMSARMKKELAKYIREGKDIIHSEALHIGSIMKAEQALPNIKNPITRAKVAYLIERAKKLKAMEDGMKELPEKGTSDFQRATADLLDRVSPINRDLLGYRLNFLKNIEKLPAEQIQRNLAKTRNELVEASMKQITNQQKQIGYRNKAWEYEQLLIELAKEKTRKQYIQRYYDAYKKLPKTYYSSTYPTYKPYTTYQPYRSYTKPYTKSYTKPYTKYTPYTRPTTYQKVEYTKPDYTKQQEYTKYQEYVEEKPYPKYTTYTKQTTYPKPTKYTKYTQYEKQTPPPPPPTTIVSGEGGEPKTAYIPVYIDKYNNKIKGEPAPTRGDAIKQGMKFTDNTPLTKFYILKEPTLEPLMDAPDYKKTYKFKKKKHMHIEKRYYQWDTTGEKTGKFNILKYVGKKKVYT